MFQVFGIRSNFTIRDNTEPVDVDGGEGGPDVSEGGGAIAAPAPTLFLLSPSGSSSSSPGLLLNPVNQGELEGG